jgi:carboxyl-terminal processing protease
MPARSYRNLFTGFLLVFFVAGTFCGGILVGWLTPRPSTARLATVPLIGPLLASSAVSASTPADMQGLFTPFWKTWQLAHDQFVKQPVDDTALMRGAISGMLQALGDKHTSYIDPEQYRQVSIPLQGGYEGIGAWVDSTGAYLTITSPMPGSPAEKAGLQPGDQILAVDGKDMTGIDGSLVIRQVTGPANSTVRLTVLREGVEKPFDVTVTRAKIDVPSIDARMLDGQVGYVRITTFGETTAQELHTALEGLMAKNPKGLVIDLRFNGGGYLQSAIDVGSEFIPDGVLLYERYGSGKEDIYNVNPGGLATKIPLVVLVNQGSASASEIVAGALQDRGRAKLVGETTYGKGSVQIWTELEGEQGAVRITVAHWYTPNNRLIDEQGLQPDYPITLTEDDIKAGKDTQLQKAVELFSPK